MNWCSTTFPGLVGPDTTAPRKSGARKKFTDRWRITHCQRLNNAAEENATKGLSSMGTCGS